MTNKMFQICICLILIEKLLSLLLINDMLYISIYTCMILLYIHSTVFLLLIFFTQLAEKSPVNTHYFLFFVLRYFLKIITGRTVIGNTYDFSVFVLSAVSTVMLPYICINFNYSILVMM